jgi:hypothetical protein
MDHQYKVMTYTFLAIQRGKVDASAEEDGGHLACPENLPPDILKGIYPTIRNARRTTLLPVNLEMTVVLPPQGPPVRAILKIRPNGPLSMGGAA